MLPNSSHATISTGGGAINIMPSFGSGTPLSTTLAPDQPLTLAKSSGPGTTTLFLNSGSVFMTTSGGATATTSINAGVTLAAQGNLTVTSAGSLSMNGAISAGTGFSATVTAGGLVAGNIAVSDGSVTLTLQSGLLQISSGANVTATE